MCKYFRAVIYRWTSLHLVRLNLSGVLLTTPFLSCQRACTSIFSGNSGLLHFVSRPTNIYFPLERSPILPGNIINCMLVLQAYHIPRNSHVKSRGRHTHQKHPLSNNQEIIDISSFFFFFNFPLSTTCSDIVCGGIPTDHTQTHTHTHTHTHIYIYIYIYI